MGGVILPFFMEFISFEEIVGVYNGDPTIIDSTIESIYKFKALDPESDGQSNVNGWQKELHHNKDFYPLREVILNNFGDYLKRHEITEPIDFEITKFFCNVNPPGASNTMHYHQVGEFSGAFWLKAEEDSGNLFIMNPYPNSFINTITKTSKRMGFANQVIEPKPNLGVFFNSNLVHFVDVNRSSSDRISVAFHIRLHNYGY